MHEVIEIEINAILKKKAFVCRVSFIGGGAKAFLVDSSTTVAELIYSISKGLGIYLYIYIFIYGTSVFLL